MKSENFDILVKRLNSLLARKSLFNLFLGIAQFFLVDAFLIFIILFTSNKYNLNGNLQLLILFITLALNIYLIFRLIIRPIRLMLGNKKIRIKKAAKILKKSNTKLYENIVNSFELSQEERDYFSKELIQKSVNQKASEANNYNFLKNIKISKVFFACCIFIIILFSLSFIYKKNKTYIKDSAKKYMVYDTKNSLSLLNYSILNNKLEVEQGKSFLLQIKFNATDIINPAINYFNNSFLLKKEEENVYTYLFNSVNNNIDFYIKAGKKTSKLHRISIISPPIIGKINIDIKPPKYTGLNNSHKENNGDITIAEGSTVHWNFELNNTKDLYFGFNNKVDTINIEKNNIDIIKVIKNSTRYFLSIANEKLKKDSLLNYKIDVIKDKFPEINYRKDNDTSQLYAFYFKGFIRDDYGLDSLLFVITHGKSLEKIVLPINNNINQEFYYYYDFNETSLLDKNKSLSYYFEVWDNDKINGSKYTRSKEEIVNKLSNTERKDLKNKKVSSMQNSFSNSMNLLNEIENNLSKLKENKIEGNLSEYEEKNIISEILEKKNELEKEIKNINKKFEEKSLYNNFDKQDIDEFVEKQQKLKELLENLLTDDIKNLLEELRKELEKRNESRKEDIYNELDLNIKDLNKELENDLELLKKFDLEENLKENLNDFKQVKEGLKEIESVKKNEIEKNQEKLSENERAFERANKEYEKLLEKNQSLKFSLDLKDFNKEREAIEEQFDEIKNSENSKRKQNEEINENIQNLNNLIEKYEDMLAENEEQMNSLNEELLKSIIENLSMVSFQQEDIFRQNYSKAQKDFILQKRKLQIELNNRIKFIFRQIDTLNSVSPELNNVVRKDLFALKESLMEIGNLYDNAKISQIIVKQQTIMKEVNDIALKLNEILENVENNSSMMSKGNCKKPGKKKPGLGNLKKQQESIKNSLEQMLKNMKSGKGKDSKGLSKMLAEQEIMKKLLNDLSNNGDIGGETKKELNQIKKLVEDNIRDIIKSKIDENYINRQNLISTRLLKAEKAEEERETEKKRKSKEGEEIEHRNKVEDFEYNKENYNFNELLNKKSLDLNLFYKNKAKEYYKKLSEEKK